MNRALAIAAVTAAAFVMPAHPAEAPAGASIDRAKRLRELSPSAPADSAARLQILQLWTSAPADEQHALFVSIANDDALFPAFVVALEENAAPASLKAFTAVLAPFAAQFPADTSIWHLVLLAIQSGGPNVQAALSAALRESPGASMLDSLFRIHGAASSDRPAAVANVAETARQGDANALKALALSARDSDPDVAQAATEWLAALAGSNGPALDEIRRMAADAQPSFRAAAIAALGLGSARRPELLDILLHAATDPEPPVRCAAMIALSPNALRRNERATAALIKATGDPDRTVRSSAVEALGAALSGGSDSARSFLTKLASSNDPDLARAARKALARQPLRKR